MSNMLEAALEYGRRGRTVFPLHTVRDGVCSCGCEKLTCRSRGKHPRRAGGFHEATTDPQRIRELFAGYPESNIGLLPGRSGLIAFDMDTPDAEAEAQRLGLLAEPTLTVKSGNPAYPGACHLYFQAPPFQVSNVRLGGTLLVRHADGYVVAPPSMHWVGRRYTVAVRVEPLPLPRAAVVALDTATAGSAPSGRLAREIPLLESFPEGSRHDSLKVAVARLVALTHGRMSADETFAWAWGLNLAKSRPAPVSESEVWQLVEWTLGREGQREGREAVPLGAPTERVSRRGGLRRVG